MPAVQIKPCENAKTSKVMLWTQGWRLDLKEGHTEVDFMAVLKDKGLNSEEVSNTPPNIIYSHIVDAVTENYCVMPIIRPFPISTATTGEEGVNKWITKGHRPVAEIPTRDDGTYRFPVGKFEVLVEEKARQIKSASKYIKEERKKVGEDKKRDEEAAAAAAETSATLEKITEALGGITDVLGKLSKRIEDVESKQQDDRKDAPKPARRRSGKSQAKTDKPADRSVPANSN